MVKQIIVVLFFFDLSLTDVWFECLWGGWLWWCGSELFFFSCFLSYSRARKHAPTVYRVIYRGVPISRVTYRCLFYGGVNSVKFNFRIWLNVYVLNRGSPVILIWAYFMFPSFQTTSVFQLKRRYALHYFYALHTTYAGAYSIRNFFIFRKIRPTHFFSEYVGGGTLLNRPSKWHSIRKTFGQNFQIGRYFKKKKFPKSER